mgnify:CR=1 FL=1
MVRVVQTVDVVSQDLEWLINGIMSASRGMLEVVAVVSKDLSILAVRSSGRDYSDEVEAAGGVIMSIVSSVLRGVDFSSPQRVRVQLDDKRYLIVYPYMDYFIVCLTIRSPKIGFIELILEYYSSENRENLLNMPQILLKDRYT